MKRPIDLGEADPRSYVRLAAHLRKRVLNGELAPGGAVPSITTFSQELGHARQTCGKAMQLLEQEGLLVRVPGRGYYVARSAERSCEHDYGSTPILPPDDFRSRRNYLPDEAFALPGEYEPPTSPLPEEQWHGLMDLPTDVLLRTTDHHGSQLGQMSDLWSLWVRMMPGEPQTAPYMFNAGWDAADDFNASAFSGAHGYYRQGVATLRSALEGLTIAASFAERQKTQGLQDWLSGQVEPPKFGNARDIIASSLGTEATEVLKRLYKELSGYMHTMPDNANIALWGGSNGPVWERESFIRLYRYHRDVMAMGYILLKLGWPTFAIPQNAWLLFSTPNGVWDDAAIAAVRASFG
jgi:hypothetical protein